MRTVERAIGDSRVFVRIRAEGAGVAIGGRACGRTPYAGKRVRAPVVASHRTERTVPLLLDVGAPSQVALAMVPLTAARPRSARASNGPLIGRRRTARAGPQSTTGASARDRHDSARGRQARRRPGRTSGGTHRAYAPIHARALPQLGASPVPAVRRRARRIGRQLGVRRSGVGPGEPRVSSGHHVLRRMRRAWVLRGGVSGVGVPRRRRRRFGRDHGNGRCGAVPLERNHLLQGLQRRRLLRVGQLPGHRLPAPRRGPGWRQPDRRATTVQHQCRLPAGIGVFLSRVQPGGRRNLRRLRSVRARPESVQRRLGLPAHRRCRAPRAHGVRTARRMLLFSFGRRHVRGRLQALGLQCRRGLPGGPMQAQALQRRRRLPLHRHTRLQVRRKRVHGQGVRQRRRVPRRILRERRVLDTTGTLRAGHPGAVRSHRSSCTPSRAAPARAARSLHDLSRRREPRLALRHERRGRSLLRHRRGSPRGHRPRGAGRPQGPKAEAIALWPVTTRTPGIRSFRRPSFSSTRRCSSSRRRSNRSAPCSRRRWRPGGMAVWTGFVASGFVGRRSKRRVRHPTRPEHLLVLRRKLAGNRHDPQAWDDHPVRHGTAGHRDGYVDGHRRDAQRHRDLAAKDQVAVAAVCCLYRTRSLSPRSSGPRARTGRVRAPPSLAEAKSSSSTSLTS